MSYRVEYFREGREIGSTSLEQPLDRAIEFAKDGMTQNKADSARIIDVDGCGAEVWSGRRDA